MHVSTFLHVVLDLLLVPQVDLCRMRSTSNASTGTRERLHGSACNAMHLACFLLADGAVHEAGGLGVLDESTSLHVLPVPREGSSRSRGVRKGAFCGLASVSKLPAR